MQEGVTCLMLAAKEGYTDIVKALLVAKADPNITDKVPWYIIIIIIILCCHCYNKE